MIEMTVQTCLIRPVAVSLVVKGNPFRYSAGQLNKLILDTIGHVDSPQYQTSVPSLHFIGA